MDLDFDDWMAYGIQKGWCGPPVCYVHDGLPFTDEEFEMEGNYRYFNKILQIK